MVLGILGLVCFGPVLGIAALICGVLGLQKSKQLGGQGKGMAISGIVLGSIDIVLGIVLIVLNLALFSTGY